MLRDKRKRFRGARINKNTNFDRVLEALPVHCLALRLPVTVT